MNLKFKKILITSLWLALLMSHALISQPLTAGVSAEFVLSIKAGLNQPTDTAISHNGDIYVLNGVLAQVLVFSEKGKLKFSFGKAGKAAGELNLAMAISIKNQQVFIADTGNARISVFNLQGKFIRQLPLEIPLKSVKTSDKSSDRLAAPVALLVMDNKIIWSDRQNHQLCASNIDNGKILNCWGGKGTAEGQFNRPYQLASDAQGYIFTVDVLNARVQAFSRKGKHFMNIGRFGVAVAGSLFRPNGLALDADNHLLVSDAYLGTISVYKNGRALGLLPGNNAEVLTFQSPTSLTLHKNKLYVTDTLNNSIEVFSLNKTKPAKNNNKSITKPQADSSRKNCVICHISWADNYVPHQNDTHQHDTRQNEAQVIPVAHQRMCYSCHHGVVIDSRASIGHKQQHPDIYHVRDNENAKNKDKNQDEIPDEFPLIENSKTNNKELYCGSCHTPHKFNTDNETSPGAEHNNSWMRELNDQGEICLQCHQSKIDNVQHEKRETIGVNHPVGIYLKADDTVGGNKNEKYYARDKNLHKGLPEEIRDAGASLNEKQQMICQSCHKVHGSDEQQLTAMQSSSEAAANAELCVSCHQRHDAKDIKEAREKGVHPVNIKLEDPVKINNKEIEFVNCLTCHSVHDGVADSALLTMDNKNGELCNVCHEDYNKVVNTDHDLRLSAKKSKNRLDQMPEQTSVCGSCHSMHEVEDSKLSLDATVENPYQGKEKPLPRDQMCLNCHHKDGAADKAQIKYFSHPVKDMILRSDKNIMPLLNKNNEITEFGSIACITCHNPHRWSAHEDIKDKVISIDTQVENPEKNDAGNILSSFLRNKEIQNSFCTSCHGIETKIKYKYYHLELSR
jgi:predicted CXXCH cytochrome family protein